MSDSPDLATHIEVEHSILLGDLAAVIQELMLKVTNLESQIKEAYRQVLTISKRGPTVHKLVLTWYVENE